MATGIRGIDTIVRGLEKEVIRLEATGLAGLLEAIANIREDMDRTEPLIPVGETGNLRSSWFVAPASDIKTRQVVLYFGFSANYALYVHEREPGAPWGDGVVPDDINWNRPGSGPKFLEESLKRNIEMTMQILQKNMKK